MQESGMPAGPNLIMGRASPAPFNKGSYTRERAHRFLWGSPCVQPMDTRAPAAVASAVLAIVSLALALWEYEGIMTVVSVVALAYGVAAYLRCTDRLVYLILATSLVALACTALSVTVLREGEDPTTLWFVGIGLVHSVPVTMLTLATYSIVAKGAKASFNWAVVRFLSPFVAMGMEVPGFVLEYVFEGADSWMTDNGYILYHFLMTLVVAIVVAYLVSRSMHRTMTIITENGTEDLKC